MSPGQQGRYLAAAGWATTTSLCPSDPHRLPERWYRRERPGRYSLDQAVRACLAAELAPGAVMIPGLTIKQPWAGAIVDLQKSPENRSWDTGYRGPLAIHAGKGWDRDGHDAAEEIAGQLLPPSGGPSRGIASLRMQ